MKRYLRIHCSFLIFPLDRQHFPHITSHGKMTDALGAFYTFRFINGIGCRFIRHLLNRDRIKPAHTLTSLASHAHLIFCNLAVNLFTDFRHSFYVKSCFSIHNDFTPGLPRSSLQYKNDIVICIRKISFSQPFIYRIFLAHNFYCQVPADMCQMA